MSKSHWPCDHGNGLWTNAGSTAWKWGWAPPPRVRHSWTKCQGEPLPLPLPMDYTTWLPEKRANRPIPTSAPKKQKNAHLFKSMVRMYDVAGTYYARHTSAQQFITMFYLWDCKVTTPALKILCCSIVLMPQRILLYFAVAQQKWCDNLQSIKTFIYFIYLFVLFIGHLCPNKGIQGGL